MRTLPPNSQTMFQSLLFRPKLLQLHLFFFFLGYPLFWVEIINNAKFLGGPTSKNCDRRWRPGNWQISAKATAGHRLALQLWPPPTGGSPGRGTMCKACPGRCSPPTQWPPAGTDTRTKPGGLSKALTGIWILAQHGTISVCVTHPCVTPLPNIWIAQYKTTKRCRVGNKCGLPKMTGSQPMFSAGTSLHCDEVKQNRKKNWQKNF